jgi:hypothetical protein
MKRGRKGSNGPAEEFGVQTETLVETLQKTGRALDKAHQEMFDVTAGDPTRVMQAINNVMGEWQASGAAELFKTKAQLAKYYQSAVLSIFVRYVAVMTRALDLLNKKLDAPEIQAPQMLAMVERLGDQIGVLRKQAGEVFEPAQVPATEEELDQRLEAARAQVKRLEFKEDGK